MGNRLAYTATLTTTQVTTYTYNAANQLVTAKLNTSPDTWHYGFDNNGNQVRQVPNGLTPAAGEVRYTFDQRNLLTRIENHNGSGYQLQAEAMSLVNPSLANSQLTPYLYPNLYLLLYPYLWLIAGYLNKLI